MKTFKQVMSLYRTHAKVVLLMTLATIVSVGTELCYPYISKRIIEHTVYMTPDHGRSELILVAICFVGFQFLQIFYDWMNMYVGAVMFDKIKYTYYKKVYDHFQKLPFHWHDDNSVGATLSIMDVDIKNMCDLLTMLPTEILQVVLELVGGVIVFATIDLGLLLKCIPVIVVFFLFKIFGTPKMYKRWRKRRDYERNLSKFLEDKMNGFRTTISFGNEGSEMAELDRRTDDVKSACKSCYKLMFDYKIIENTLGDWFYNLVLLFGAYDVITGKRDITTVLMFYMYAHMIVNPIKSLYLLTKNLPVSLAGLRNTMDFLEIDTEIKNPKHPVVMDVKGEIEFKEVDFQYKEKKVLDHVNLKIQKGEYVALVGLSGCGKSTIANLIPRFYDIQSGAIKIDGVDIRDMDLECLRKNVGMVQQDVYLFSGTIYDNIRYGKLDASEEEIIRAAKLANAHEFIMKTPNGYQSQVGEKGVKLSGGQKQRIAIARLFLANPPILIFDEATSALDEVAQKEVQIALEAIAKDRTTIVIAHRLSTIQNADRIIFLSENGIEEEGTHSELIEKAGKYAQLYTTVA